MSDVLTELTAVLEQRKRDGDSEGSYVASLHAKGLNKILEKVGEEATEVILAAKDYAAVDSGAVNEESAIGNETLRSDMIAETADLWFHSLVMLSHLDASADDVLAELARRFDLSGLVEKANRTKS